MSDNNDIGKTIQPIFFPAISVLNRINYTRKFTLLWLMSLVAIAVVTYSLFVSLDRVIQPSQRELQGLVLIEPVSRTVQLIQLHRGLSTALLGGNETMRGRRTAQEREAAEAFEALEGKLPPSLASGEDFRNIKSSWEALRKEGLHWTAGENFDAHTILVERLQSFEGLIADDYALILDAELDTYYLIDTNVNKLPHVLEHLGQLRAYGTGILARKQINESQKAKLNALSAELDSTLKEFRINIEKTGRYNPEVQKSLLAAYAGIAGSARQITGLVASDILTGHFATPPEAFLDMATAEIDNGYTQMHQVLLPTTQTLIEARIARAEKTLRMTVSIAVLLLLLVVYLSVSIYYAIIGSIRLLVRSAHTIAGGDLNVRVKLDTRDELSHIGDSFNKMADGFNALLEERKRAGESLARESYRNEMLLRTASDGIHILDLDGNVVQVNDAFCRMLGYTTEEMLVMNAAQWDAQWTAAQIKAKIDALCSDASIIKTRHRRRDGSIIDVEISVVKVDIDGQQLVYCSSRDVTERKQAEKALLDKEHLLSESQRIAHIGSWFGDLTGQILWTDETYHIYGVSPDTFTPSAESFFNLIHPDDRPAMRAWVDACATGKKPGDLEFRINMPDGTVRFLSGRGELQYDAGNKPSHMTGTVQDITERKQAERALVENKSRLHAVIETALDAVVQMDDEGIITGWNTQAENIFGWLREEAVGRLMHETIIPPQYREAHKQGLKRFLAAGEGAILNRRVELMGLHRDGREFPVELAVVPIKMSGKTEDKYEFSAFIHDITNRKKAEDLIWKHANFDMLTGLPNRHMFFDRLAQEIKKAERTALPMALLYIDLDRFKEINDTLGHGMGDKLLVEAARRISSCVREADTVARMGGDEFIIALTESHEISRVDALAQDILHRLAEPFRLESEEIHLSASVGITLYPHDATAVEDLVKNADQALYAAKNAGRNRFGYFAQSMQQTAQAKLRLVSDLRSALAASQFLVYYQPIMELATGRIHKAEALIRWQHPVRGMVSPAEFIPLAEEIGLIVEIGDWVFREAAHHAKQWKALHDPEFQISVNMSPVQFHSASSPCQAWPVYLRKLGLSGQNLVIEITEGLLLNEETGVKDKLRQFHEAGIQISLDDFGTGYSSLSYLQKYDIDFLKIDQSFTRGLEPGSKNMALSEAIIVMAHKLGLKVIAEGIETEMQRALLAAAGCDYGQGYLFSRPLPAEKFEELLKGALTGLSSTATGKDMA